MTDSSTACQGLRPCTPGPLPAYRLRDCPRCARYMQQSMLRKRTEEVETMIQFECVACQSSKPKCCFGEQQEPIPIGHARRSRHARRDDVMLTVIGRVMATALPR